MSVKKLNTKKSPLGTNTVWDTFLCWYNMYCIKKNNNCKSFYYFMCLKMQKIWVVGLGYVGLPLAYSFDQAGFEVVGFDIFESKIEDLKNGIDSTKEIWSKIKDSGILFTCNSENLKSVDIIINCVPTPINKQKNPDLIPLQKSSETIGKILQSGQIVVYESTVYPGCTEEVCIPILEKMSWLKCPQDFGVGYSPERINPGDKVHTVENIIKVVSGIDKRTLDILAELYSQIIKAGVHKASCIKVAEASKVIENTQRDINIALMNELSAIFEKIGIDTQDVLAAAGTKWNFLKFYPGLVWGHCIGVDPYWLAYKAEEVGHHPEIILAWRRINELLIPKFWWCDLLSKRMCRILEIVRYLIRLRLWNNMEFRLFDMIRMMGIWMDMFWRSWIWRKVRWLKSWKGNLMLWLWILFIRSLKVWILGNTWMMMGWCLMWRGNWRLMSLSFMEGCKVYVSIVDGLNTRYEYQKCLILVDERLFDMSGYNFIF